jgi:hypothetical protein
MKSKKKKSRVVNTEIAAPSDDPKGEKVDEECPKPVVTERPNESLDNMLKPDTTQMSDPFKNEVKPLTSGRVASQVNLSDCSNDLIEEELRATPAKQA